MKINIAPENVSKIVGQLVNASKSGDLGKRGAHAHALNERGGAPKRLNERSRKACSTVSTLKYTALLDLASNLDKVDFPEAGNPEKINNVAFIFRTLFPAMALSITKRLWRRHGATLEAARHGSVSSGYHKNHVLKGQGNGNGTKFPSSLQDG